MANQMKYKKSDEKLKKTQPVVMYEGKVERGNNRSQQTKTDTVSNKIYYYTTLPNGTIENDNEVGGDVYEESEDGIMYTPKRPASILRQQQTNDGG